MFWLNSQVELFCQEVILVQPYGYQPFLRQRGNAWSKIADSLNYIDNSKFDVNQRSVRGRYNLILTRYKIKISADIKAIGIEVKEEAPTENLLEELDEKVKEAEAEFEAKTLT